MAAKLAALYYPHAGVRSEAFLKNALLLWDEVSFIWPFGTLPDRSDTEEEARAFAAIARPLNPSYDEKRLVHDAIVELAESELPDWFLPERSPDLQKYYVDPRKLLPETWEALFEANLTSATTVMIDDPPWPGKARVPEKNKHRQQAYETTEKFGHLLMSMIAEVCAGGTRQLITEEKESYAAIDRYYRLIGGADPQKQPLNDYDRLVTLSLETLDLSNVDIGVLASIREKENAQPQLRKMRHSYVNKLETYIKRLSTDAKSPRDIEQIEKQFQQEVHDDIGLLREELKDEAKKLLFSKEFYAAAVILAGTVLHPAAPVAAAVPLLGSKTQYKIARNKALSGHAMSWLYESTKRFKPF